MIKIVKRPLLAATPKFSSLIKAPGEVYTITDTRDPHMLFSFLFRITDDRSSLFVLDCNKKCDIMVYVRRLPGDVHDARQARQYLVDKALSKLKIEQQFRAQLRLAFMMQCPVDFGSPFLAKVSSFDLSTKTPITKPENDPKLVSTISRSRHRFYIRRDIALSEVEKLIRDINQKLSQIDNIIQNCNKNVE